MNNKGFSLIELLAVIAILAIILLIFTPSITKMIDNFRNDDKTEILKSSAISAAKEYVVDGNVNSKINLSSCSPTTKITINIQDLIEEKYLEISEDETVDYYNGKTITVTYDCVNKKFIEYIFN